MNGFRDALNNVEWPSGDEVMKKFALVIIVLLLFLAFIAAVDGILGYLLGFIY